MSCQVALLILLLVLLKKVRGAALIVENFDKKVSFAVIALLPTDE